MLLCGNMLVHVVMDLQNASAKASEKKYRLLFAPVIYADFENHKKDKKSDYVICKVKNRRYLAIIEIKLNVGSALSAKKLIGC